MGGNFNAYGSWRSGASTWCRTQHGSMKCTKLRRPILRRWITQHRRQQYSTAWYLSTAYRCFEWLSQAWKSSPIRHDTETSIALVSDRVGNAATLVTRHLKQSKCKPARSTAPPKWLFVHWHIIQVGHGKFITMCCLQIITWKYFSLGDPQAPNFMYVVTLIGDGPLCRIFWIRARLLWMASIGQHRGMTWKYT